MIVNSLLGYVAHCHRSSTIGNIKMVIINFYNEMEIITAKKVIWADQEIILGKYQPRHSSENRPAIEAYVVDILDAIRKLDSKGKMPDILVKDLNRIPDRNPEEMNFLYYVNRVNDLEKSSNQQRKIIEDLCTNMMAVQHQLKQSNGNAPNIPGNIENTPAGAAAETAAETAAAATAATAATATASAGVVIQSGL